MQFRVAASKDNLNLKLYKILKIAQQLLGTLEAIKFSVFDGTSAALDLKHPEASLITRSKWINRFVTVVKLTMSEVVESE